MTEKQTLLSFTEALECFPSEEYTKITNGTSFEVAKLKKLKVEVKEIDFEGKKKTRFFFEYDGKKFAIGKSLLKILSRAIEGGYRSVSIIREGEGLKTEYSGVYEK